MESGTGYKEENDCFRNTTRGARKMNQVYTLPADMAALWFFPALFLGGLLLQIVCFARQKRPLLYAGSGMVLLAAALDRDITLAAGQLLAVWLMTRHG